MSHKARIQEYSLTAAQMHAHACLAWSREEQLLLRALAALAEESAIYRASRALRTRGVVDAPGSSLDGVVVA